MGEASRGPGRAAWAPGHPSCASLPGGRRAGTGRPGPWHQVGSDPGSAGHEPLSVRSGTGVHGARGHCSALWILSVTLQGEQAAWELESLRGFLPPGCSPWDGPPSLALALWGTVCMRPWMQVHVCAGHVHGCVCGDLHVGASPAASCKTGRGLSGSQSREPPCLPHRPGVRKGTSRPTALLLASTSPRAHWQAEGLGQKGPAPGEPPPRQQW